MSKRLLLTKSKTFPWAETEQLAFRGYFTAKGVLYKDLDAIAFVRENLKHHEFSTVLSKMNGMFSLIYDNDCEVRFATDRVRGLPLFYALIDSEPIISDSAHEIYDVLPNCTLDPISVEDYRNNELFVTGRFTFYREIMQVQAGEWVSFDKRSKTFCSGFYFRHADGIIDHSGEQELLTVFQEVFTRACENLRIGLDGRTAVVPLSGGIDSREILLMLHTVGYKKVLCFTYGKKGSEECKLASQVAKHFGYKWLEVQYTRSRWKEFSKEPIYEEYLTTQGNFVSLPHTQDLLAICLLKKDGLLPKDSVFLPGHTGTIIGGSLHSRFLDGRPVDRNQFLKLVGEIYKRTNSSDLTVRFNSYFELLESMDCNQAAVKHHCFVMKERQAKFIINSVRVYEFLGYEWLLPLCDLNFLDFFKCLPLTLKQNKKFIRTFMGLQHIRSTRDPTIWKGIKESVRGVPSLRLVGRRMKILAEYFGSNQQSGGLHGLTPYLRGILGGSQHFTSNSIASEKYLSFWEEKYDR